MSPTEETSDPYVESLRQSTKTSRKLERLLELSSEHEKLLLDPMQPTVKNSRVTLFELLKEVFRAKVLPLRKRGTSGSRVAAKICVYADKIEGRAQSNIFWRVNVSGRTVVPGYADPEVWEIRSDSPRAKPKTQTVFCTVGSHVMVGIPRMLRLG